MRHGTEFEEFYRANYGRIRALLMAVLGNADEADDAAQEAFARALARWPRVSGYDAPEAWVRQVALRLAVDSGRRLRRSLRLTAKLQQTARPPEPAQPTVTFSAIGSALMRLPLREREVIVLHYFADMPADRIAAERRLPTGTVKARLAAGRRRLERELAADPEEAHDAR